MAEVVVRRWEPAELRRRLGEIVELYRRVYAEPPYFETDEDVAVFAERFPEQVDRDGFTLVAAEDVAAGDVTAGGQGTLIGYAYGLTFGPGQWWHNADEPAETVGGAKFAGMELVLDRSYRGRGLSGRLAAASLADRPEPYATLCVKPDAAARQIYAHWGWRLVGQAHGRDAADAFDVFILPLPETPGSSQD